MSLFPFLNLFSSADESVQMATLISAIKSNSEAIEALKTLPGSINKILDKITEMESDRTDLQEPEDQISDLLAENDIQEDTHVQTVQGTLSHHSCDAIYK